MGVPVLAAVVLAPLLGCTLSFNAPPAPEAVSTSGGTETPPPAGDETSANELVADGGDDKLSEPAEKASPAPRGAIAAGLIQSASLNISCEISNDRASCSILDRAYGSRDCPDRLFSATIDEVAAPACGQEFLGQVGDPVTTLHDGMSVASDTFACTASGSGITCWNQYNGHGFTISEDAYSPF